MSRKQSPQQSGNSWLRSAGLQVFAGLVVLFVFVYGQLATHEFILLDDDSFVTENRVVQAGVTWPGIMYAFESVDQGSWHPLTWISHMAMVDLVGFSPGGHHLANVVLHAVSSILLFLFLRSLTGAVWRSVLVASVFALHPLHVEPVAWVAERKEMLAALFWLLTSLAWLRWVRAGGRVWYAITLVLYILGLMSKPTIITLPFALLLLDYWPLDRLKAIADARARIVEKIPFFVLSIAGAAATYYGQQFAGAFSDLGDVPLLTRLMSVAVNYAFYLGRTFWPVNLAPHYPFSGTVGMGEFALSFGILAAITAAVLWKGRERRYLIVGWLWFLGVLVPMAGFVYAGGSIRSDRFTYMPHTGLAILIIWLLHDLLGERRNSRFVWVAAALLVVAMSVRAWHQAAYWKDTETLFQHTLAVTRNNAVAHHVLSVTYLKASKGPDSLHHASEAVRINPRHGQAWTMLARLNYARKELPAALASIDRAVAVMPASGNTQYNRAMVLLEMKRDDDAVAALKKAIDLGISVDLRSLANFEIGRVHMRRKASAEAVPYFQNAIALDTGYLLARKNLAFALLDLKRYREAQTHLKVVAVHLPADDDVRGALEQLRKMGDLR